MSIPKSMQRAARPRFPRRGISPRRLRRAPWRATVARHGFLGYRSYVSKAGRARFIEVGVLLPAELRLAIGELDAFRAEIGAAIGGEGPDRWLTIQFTADPKHL